MASYYPHPRRADEVLDQTGTADIERRWTNKLSGGQARRVRFAAALVSNPDLLVLDEPTAGIDVEGRREIWRAVRAVAERGKTAEGEDGDLDQHAERWAEGSNNAIASLTSQDPSSDPDRPWRSASSTALFVASSRP